MTSDDRLAVVCNLIDGGSYCRDGSLCYVTQVNDDRVQVVVRSRSGRWIQRWTSIKNIRNARTKTITPKNQFYCGYRIDLDTPSLLSLLPLSSEGDRK